ncbi:ABC transporter ATP-binding protein [Oryzomonas rubra]|uniref:ABC transporter ATP-binding protein n=1 Tax=Oryzomonas rubra TaxID=2509454 RepID=A0A5A9XRW8_9BACT|nr:ABC transporter ATP-binding protein [Oryzomonas rubra]KAA0895303.1 ABC transporter ATP-binding protein [Oryzomonas rubra]
MSTVITVENLGKKYLLRHQSGKQPYVALRDVLSDGVRNLGRKLLGQGKATAYSAEQEEFWALKDVSFEVKQGDRIGIIGRNGAGKSTLLKILSRITEPTRGSVRIKGRVASLLEVGTGFHPELTGRENIYLNGAILGMSRAEIKQKFDEIVDFAEIEKFLDTPVKRYSSGMYVRLAFAVAAHLEPEILVVDEVLAVGDAQFQKKCLGKMEDVSAKEGRTVLFVSHNMGAVAELCTSAMVMSEGAIYYHGDVPTSVSRYMSHLSDMLVTVRDLAVWPTRTGSGAARIVRATLTWESGDMERACPALGDTLIISFDVERLPQTAPNDLRLSVAIRTITGVRTLHVANEDDHFTFPEALHTSISVEFPDLRLYPGLYSVSLWVGSNQYVDYDYVQDCLNFEVVQGDRLPRNFKSDWSQGLVYHESRWRNDR